MTGILYAAAGLAAAGGLAWAGYRSAIPKARALSKTSCDIVTQTMMLTAAGHTLYGKWLLPKDADGPLPAVICAHGFNGSHRYFSSYVGKSLAMSGFAVYCFDFFGGSVRSKSGGSMTEMSVFTEREELSAVLERVKTMDFVDPERLYLFGESQGGFVAAITAARQTADIRALVLYYPAFCAKDDMLKLYPTPESLPYRPKLMGKTLGRVYYEGLYDFDVYAELGWYDGPVLIVHGTGDKVVDCSYSRRAADAYADAALELLPGQPHGFNARGKKHAARLTYDFLMKNGGAV